jgi:predicted permease
MSVFDSIAYVARRVRAFVQREELASQLDEELDFHAAMIAERERGVDARDGSTRARKRVGNRTRIREDARDAWTFAFVERTLQDGRYALRGMVARPLFSATIVLTLALGIGANTAVFSLINWLLFQPVPGVTQPNRLVTIRFGSKDSLGSSWFLTSYPVLEDLRREVRTLRDIAGYERADVHISAGAPGSAWRAGGEIVSPNYFAVLGARPALGRVFSPDDATAIGSHDEVVISDRAWRAAFAADPTVVGRTILVNARPAVIVGVMRGGFLGPQLPGNTDYWVPVSMHPRIIPDYLPTKLLQDREATFMFQLIGRLRDDATISLADREVKSIYERVTAPTSGSRVSEPSIEPILSPGLGLPEYERGRVSGMVAVLGAVVVLVLLTACANTANLLLARGVSRRHEMAIRRAIGAGRGRLIRQHLTECAVLATLGGAAAVALAWALVRSLSNVRLIQTMLPLGIVDLDVRVIAFAFGCTLLSVGVFGIVPAVLSTRADPQTALRAGAYRTPAGARLRGALMALQMALSLILLVGAGLFLRTLANLRGVKLGVDVAAIATIGLDLSAQGYDATRTRSFYTDLLERLNREPATTAASLVWLPMFGEGAADGGFWRAEADSTASVDARINNVSPGFFGVAGVRILRGRTFRDDETVSRDTTGAQPVIVNAALAKQLFGPLDPVGRRLRRKYYASKEYEIVGVVADARTVRVAAEPEPYLYQPLASGFLPKRTTLMVRAATDVAAATAAVRRVVRSIDPTLPVFDVRPLSAQIDRQLFEQIALTRLTTVFATVAVLLAAVGLYGLLSFMITERTREFGIRAALGGRGRALVIPVLRSVTMLGAVGLLAGSAVAAATTKLVRNRLYGIDPLDIPTFLGAATLLAAIAVAAALVPAWRAAGVDPLVALRRD